MTNKLNKILLAGALALSLSSCTPKPTISMKTEGETTELKQSSRYSVTRVGVFEDDLAYNDRRGIYEITDTKTGVTYIGVSGIGITELGSHAHIVSNGKNGTITMIIPDER